MRLFKRKDSPYWWVSGRNPDGSRWRASTGQQGRRAAEKAGRVVERQRLDAAESGLVPVRLDEAIEVLRKHKVRKGCSDATLKILDEKAARLTAVLGASRDVTRLTLADTEAYLDARRRDTVKRHGEVQPTSDHTIAKELATLKAALRQLRRHDIYPGDPAAIWPEELSDVYTPRDRWLTVAEYRRLLLALPPHRVPYVALYCQTGLRYSELYGATREGGALVVTQTKGNRRTGEVTSRLVPLSAEATAILDANPLPWKRWHRSRMVQGLKAATSAAGVGHVSTNDFRRTFASWLCQAGVPELTVIKLMGHHSSRMVRRVYAQLAPETLEAAVLKLPCVLPSARAACQQRAGLGAGTTETTDTTDNVSARKDGNRDE